MLAHGIYANDEEIEVLKGISGGIVHNPISNMKRGRGLANVSKLRKNGVSVALGTDDQGSSGTLDMFEEIKMATYLQKAMNYSIGSMSAEDTLKMATIEGARVLRNR